MAGLTLPKLFTAGVLSLGFVSVALAQDPPEPEEAQTYLISDFDGNGTAIDDQGVTVAFAFANNWEWDYGYSHSTIANETNEKGEYIALVDDGSGSNQVLGFYGLSAEGDGEPAGYSLGLRVPNHLAGCQVVSYRYKGASHKIKFLMEGNPTADNNHFYWSNASKNWTTVVFRTSSMEQDYGWGNEVDLNVDDVYEIQWEKPGSEYDLNYLYVDDVQCVDPPVYTVNFYHGDDLLYSEKFLEGQMPQISKYFDDFSTDAYNYRILGWDPALAPVTADIDYQAVLDSTIRSYYISFEDPYGYGGQSLYLPYGSMPEYVGTPTRFPSEGYTYTFKGWGKEVCGWFNYTYCEARDAITNECVSWVETDESYYDCRYEATEIAPVMEEFSYYPMFDSTLRQYTVTFADYDGRILSEKIYDYGTYSSNITIPDEPSRTGYSFDGWKPYVNDVKGDVTYIANYTADNGKYAVTFMDGSQVLQTGEYDLGEFPEYTGTIPVKEPTIQYEYTFAKWGDVDNTDEWIVHYYDKYDDGIYEVRRNTVYKPVWAESCRKYWVVFNDEDGTPLDSSKVCYGNSRSEFKGTTKADTSDRYEHAGWIREGDPIPETDYWFEDWKPVLERTVFVALYRYYVNFVSDDGTPIYGAYYSRGVVPTLPSNVSVSKTPTVDYTYEFAGWDREITAAMAPETYMAFFVPVPVPPSPVLNIADGGEFVIDDFEDGDETSELETEWFAYNDNEACKDSLYGVCVNYYESTISKQVVAESEQNNILRVEYSRDGWVGIGLPLDASGSLNLSNCSAIQYDYKGGRHDFRVESPYGTDDRHFSKYIGASDDWITAVFYWSEFENYYSDLPIDVVRSRAVQFVWELYGEDGFLEIDNVKCLNKPSYVVRFYDEDGTTLLDSAVFAEGENPIYRGELDLDEYAESLGNEEFEYSVGWTPELNPASQNVDYTLTFVSGKKKYSVDFYTGKEWHEQEVEYGEIPEYNGPDPERSPDTRCKKYAFDKWRYYDDDIEEDVYGLTTPVTQNRDYWAEFTCEEWVTYTVTFLDEDGELLFTKEMLPGSMLYGITAEKPSTDQFEYYFTGWEGCGGMVWEPMTCTAQFESVTRQYPVRFVNYDGEPLYVDWDEERYYEYGTSLSEVALPDDEPTREDPEGLVEYIFAGWTPAFDESAIVTGPMTFVATFTNSSNKYTVTFMNGDQVLWYKDYALDETPVYGGDSPVRSDDAQYSYAWNADDGWEEPIVKVDGPAIYHAKFTATTKSYEIVFLDDDGTELYRNTYEYGTTITDAPAETAVMAGKDGDFEGWCDTYESYCKKYDDDDKECLEYSIERGFCRGLQQVTGAETYMANIVYEVTFNNYDGTKIYSSRVWRGENLSDELREIDYDYRDRITRPSTAQFDYVWNGAWDKEVVPVTGSVVYTAVFDEVLRQYTVTFKNEDGTVLKEATAYDYNTPGSDVELPAETPTKEPTVSQEFTFAGWDVADVTANVTYVAQYTASPRKYLVKFVDEDGVTEIDTPVEYDYDTPAGSIDEPTAPIKANRKFVGWIPEIADVTGEATYMAQYMDNALHVVTWRNADGTLLYQQGFAEGATPVYGGATPTMESTDEFDFEWTGWSPSMEGVTVDDDMEFVATYDAVTRKYHVVFVNYDESPLLDVEYAYGTPAADIELPSETPVKPSTEAYVYTFIGWTPTVEDVTGPATYKAMFAAKPITSSSSSAAEESSSSAEESSSSEEESSSSETPVVSSSSEEPEESSSSEEPVVSSSSEEPEVSSSSETPEESSSSVQMFTVTYGCFNLPDPSVVCPMESISPVTVEYGTLVSSLIPEGTPTIEPTQKYTFTFDGWYRYVSSVKAAELIDGEIIEGNIKLVAVFAWSRNQYKIAFVDWDGSEIASDDYEYDTPATDITPDDPTRDPDDEFSYAFAGWSPAVADVTGEATYRATYTATPLPSSSSEAPVVSSSSETPVVSSSSETPVVSSSSETPVVSSSSETVVASSSSEAVKPSSSSADKPKSSSSEEDEVESSSSKGSESIFPTVAGGVKMFYGHNELTVTVQGSAPVKVQVFDMQGNLQQNYLGSSAGDHVVSLAQLKRGNYVVRVVRGSAVKSMRVAVR